MEKVYGIRPNPRHYTCVVDMLSRAGRLREAEEFIASMPCQSEANAWSERLSEVVEAKLGAYVLLSNSYAPGWRWVDGTNTKDVMSRKGIKKSGGCPGGEQQQRRHRRSPQ